MCGDLAIYASFEEFSDAEDDHAPRYPESLIAAVAADVGVDRIEELDI
jgi:hypothetical protein